MPKFQLQSWRNSTENKCPGSILKQNWTLYFHSSSILKCSTDSWSNFSSKGAVHGGLWPSPAAPSKVKETSQLRALLNFEYPQSKRLHNLSQLLSNTSAPQDENLHQSSPQCSLVHCPLPSTSGRDLRLASIHLSFREHNCFNTGLNKWHQIV